MNIQRVYETMGIVTMMIWFGKSVDTYELKQDQGLTDEECRFIEHHMSELAEFSEELPDFLASHLKEMISPK